MTATFEQKELARQIVARVWRGRNEGAAIHLLMSGQCDHYREMQAALAAIIETTERVVEIADHMANLSKEKEGVCHQAAFVVADGLARIYESGEHLKGTINDQG